MTQPQHHILLIDDDAMNREMMQIALERAKFRVSLAASAARGLEMAHTENPNAILLDIRLNDSITGFEVCEQLKADPATEAIPVIILSAYENEDERQRALQAGAIDFIPKMKGWAAVVERLRALLG